MGDVLRVVQLNCGSLIEPGWDERRHEVVAWLDRLAPDVVCLQEVWATGDEPSTAHWTAEAAAGRWHVAFDGAPFDPRLWPDESMRFGSAILSRWPIEDQALHRLPTVSDDLMIAGVPWELLWVSTAGLDVFSTHLVAPPQNTLDRQAQVLEVVRLIESTRGDKDELVFGGQREAMPAILCGDFNAEPDSDEIRFLRGLTALDGRTTFFQDAWVVAGEGPGLTQDWRVCPLAAALNVHRKRIDYCFVGDTFRRAGHAGRVKRAELAFHEPLTGTMASDHLGLVVEITWPTRPT